MSKDSPRPWWRALDRGRLTRVSSAERQPAETPAPHIIASSDTSRPVKDRLLLSLQPDVFPGSGSREMVYQAQCRLLQPRSYAHEEAQFEDGREHDLLIGEPLDL